MKATIKGVIMAVAALFLTPALGFPADMGKLKYDDFQKPDYCASCHIQIHEEWAQSLMSQSYTHKWDEVEYFKLALPHALKLEKVSGVKAGCIACHGPLAFLSGDIPPKPVVANTRANEGVSCEICHNITGSTEKAPYNFSFTIDPNGIKRGPRKDAESPAHGTQFSEFTRSPELCATCHDEQSPYGAWVKETYREWKAGPYAKEGTRCQDCHMYHSPGKSTDMGPERKDIAHHVFHGSHWPNKLAGVIDLALYTENATVSPGQTINFRAELFNGKAGHFVPSGSTEERMLWLEVWAVDAKGRRYPVPVTKKGFKDEGFTIADSKTLAYQDYGEIMNIKGFKGLKRDGNVPDGARIFRRPFFNPKGEMTTCQWYTVENTRVDYRIGPRETKIEHYSFNLPKNLPKGALTIEARLYYSEVPSSVGDFFKLPKEEYAPILVNENRLLFAVK
ncbi:MAG: multiheme c-type cytochrome [Dissulfurimicrobium sp.]|uniref:multiheme c-type cytochrome n=1 Tax=Dissulfurimicrobium TaxID=1769732 RepID=UPI001EDC6915|nr:multiheme c-type cytochrome [Dissulfurimicrobium hydrothermale]UKL13890.1 cytochrome c3 family protein [Dissulfurimicrobium hydrothermale]